MEENSDNSSSVGILAYGSLISDPGQEIEDARIDTIDDVTTPFHVEFARSSNGRGGAPTLVPVDKGGAQVKGRVIVVNLSESEAASVLYRREINKVGQDKKYRRPKTVTPNTVLVEPVYNFAGLKVVLYTKIAATIDPLTAERLADLAIASVAKSNPGRDGISYLIDAKRHGISTALSAAYEEEILRKTGCHTLDEAAVKARE